MRDLRDIIEHHLGKEHSEDFAEWAFGEDYMILIGSLAFMRKWNTLHGNDLRLSGDGSVEDDVKKMIKMCEEK